MRLLILSNKPYRASFRQRIGIHLQTLETNGINCEVVAWPCDVLSRLSLLRKAKSFDAVFLQKKRMGVLEAAVLRRCARRVIYDIDDAVMYSDGHPEKRSLLRMMRFGRTARLANMVIAGNEYLAREASRFNRNVKVVATGLDTREYNVQATGRGDGKVRLVWIGSKSTLAYLEQIRAALEETGRRFPNAVLKIICDEFLHCRQIAVEKCFWTMESQAAELAAGDIGLAPLPDDRFTRGKCGFKILQYQAVGLPTVTSPVGVNGEYISDGLSGYHATTTAEWVEKLSRLIADAELRKRMGQAAKEHVKQFDVSVIGSRLVELIKQCIGTT